MNSNYKNYRIKIIVIMKMILPLKTSFLLVVKLRGIMQWTFFGFFHQREHFVFGHVVNVKQQLPCSCRYGFPDVCLIRI